MAHLVSPEDGEERNRAIEKEIARMTDVIRALSVLKAMRSFRPATDLKTRCLLQLTSLVNLFLPPFMPLAVSCLF